MTGLRPYQREALDAVTAAWAEGMQRPAVVMATGLGKSQPVDEPVLTPTGWRKIGELSVGDLVIGSTGTPTAVTGVFPQGVRPTVVVQFSDETEVRCDTEHLWNVQTRFMKNDAKRRKGSAWRTLTAAQLLESSQQWFVPVVDPVEYEASEDLPMDPYTLGVLLGDGGLSVKGHVRLHTRHDLIPLLRLPEGIRAVLYRDQGVMGNYSISGRPGPAGNSVLTVLRGMGLHGHTAHGKFVPEVYLRSSSEDRLNLLQGILDTDGSASGSGVDYVTVSERLADGVAELVRSLGGRCRIVRKQTTWTYLGEKKRGMAYRAYVTLPRSTSPFRVARKKDALNGRQQFDPVKRIDVVRPGPELECVCISVDAPDHLYVTTGYAVTHNTVMFTHTAREYLQGHPGQRVVVLAHRDELVDQAIAKVKAVAPELRVGKVKAGDDEVDADVVVASVQTLAGKRRMTRLLDAGPVGLVIADEVHHYLSKTYRGVLEGLGCFTEDGAKMLGVTATLARGDGKGLGTVVDDVVYTKSILWGIRNGYLVEPKGISVAVDGLDLSKLRKSAGDYAVGALGEELTESGAMAVAAAAYVEHGGGKPGVVFTPTVATAQEVMKELELLGVTAAVVSGETPREERLRIFADYEAGEIQVLANCMVLTEGWDAPHAEVLVMARPTQSQPLYCQVVGRVLRPYPGKTGALILDLVGASQDNRLRTLIDLEEGLFPDAKPCQECRRIPCACLCGGCGNGKLRCTCPKESAPEPVLKGFGGSLELFAASSSAWLKTRKGVNFLACGSMGEVVLWLEDGNLYSVAHAPRMGPWVKLYPPRSLETAMAWAEVEAEELGGVLTLRKARWRKDPATDAQKSNAIRLGIPVPDGVRKGDLGDLMTVFYASKKIDRFMKE